MHCQDLAALWPEGYAELGCCQDCHDEEAAEQDRLQPRTLPDGRTASAAAVGLSSSGAFGNALRVP